MKKLLFISIIFLSGLIFFAGSSFASNISFETEPTVNTGENLDVVVKADTEGVLINGIEFIIDYDQNLLSFTGYSDDNAVVKLWINPPEEKEGKIYLSGIVPGGVLGLYDANKKGESRSNELSPIPLVHLFFTAKNTGKANFSFVDSKILQNDGQGTPLGHNTLQAEVMIKENPNGKTIGAERQENAPKENPPASASSPVLIFLAVIIVIICGVLGRKLLKYKL